MSLETSSIWPLQLPGPVGHSDIFSYHMKWAENQPKKPAANCVWIWHLVRMEDYFFCWTYKGLVLDFWTNALLFLSSMMKMKYPCQRLE